MTDIQTVGDLFSDKRHSWGLRGDPYLWDEMRLHFEKVPLPVDELSLIDQLNQAFFDLTGQPLSSLEVVCVERFAHGGMSSGKVSPEFWRNTAIPQLAERFRDMQQQATLRIGTWNVWYAFEKRLPALQEVTRINPADIWILTETHDDLVPFGCENVVHSTPRPKNWSGIRVGSRWVSIWSKYPLQAVPVELSDEKRTVVALADLGAKGKLLIYGTVLPWKDDQAAGWSEHHRVIEQQSVEWLMLRKAYPDIPLCIAGDYNSDMLNGRRYGTKEGVEAINRGLAQCETVCATVPDRFPEGLLNVLPIDHVAIPRAWQERTSVVAAWPAEKEILSDHSGMVVEVVF